MLSTVTTERSLQDKKLRLRVLPVFLFTNKHIQLSLTYCSLSVNFMKGTVVMTTDHVLEANLDWSARICLGPPSLEYPSK